MKYNPETGVFVAKVSAGRRKAGDVLGYVRVDGYRMIRWEGRWRYAHSLAWFYMTGEWPPNEVDHINGLRDDNRFKNLRLATRSQNMMNTRKRGVCFHTRQRKWVADIRADGKRTHIGSFDTEREAIAAYQAACLEMHGEFANIEAEKPKAAEQTSLLDDNAA